MKFLRRFATNDNVETIRQIDSYLNWIVRLLKIAGMVLFVISLSYLTAYVTLLIVGSYQ
jgi:hypothetical protein